VKRVVKDHVNDIIDSMNKAMKFIEGMSYEQFTRDDKTVFAVVRALEIIGEAVKKIPEEIRVKYPEIPWKGMAGMRNKVIHEYFGVNLKYVWEIVGKRIPELKPMFEKLRET
jgi:uncharacterized protein with HEPN domain